MRAADGSDPSIPDDVSVIAFGDVHGCLDKLEPLLKRIEKRVTGFPGRRHIVVSVGDLIDRGPESAGVVERLSKGVAGCETVVLRGNHEQMMLDFIAGGEDAEAWLYNGGFDTLTSYGLDLHAAVAERSGTDGLRRALMEKLPAHHLRFLRQAPLFFECGDYFFVHAGVRPGIRLDQQAEQDLIWIREEFLLWKRPFAKKIVHGHTPVATPTIKPNRINLDTGACFGGALTAVLLEGADVTLFP